MWVVAAPRGSPKYSQRASAAAARRFVHLVFVNCWQPRCRQGACAPDAATLGLARAAFAAQGGSTGAALPQAQLAAAYARLAGQVLAARSSSPKSPYKAVAHMRTGKLPVAPKPAAWPCAPVARPAAPIAPPYTNRRGTGQVPPKLNARHRPAARQQDALLRTMQAAGHSSACPGLGVGQWCGYPAAWAATTACTSARSQALSPSAPPCVFAATTGTARSGAAVTTNYQPSRTPGAPGRCQHARQYQRLGAGARHPLSPHSRRPGPAGQRVAAGYRLRHGRLRQLHRVWCLSLWCRPTMALTKYFTRNLLG